MPKRATTVVCGMSRGNLSARASSYHPGVGTFPLKAADAYTKSSCRSDSSLLLQSWDAMFPLLCPGDFTSSRWGRDGAFSASVLDILCLWRVGKEIPRRDPGQGRDPTGTHGTLEGLSLSGGASEAYEPCNLCRIAGRRISLCIRRMLKESRSGKGETSLTRSSPRTLHSGSAWQQRPIPDLSALALYRCLCAERREHSALCRQTRVSQGSLQMLWLA